MRFLSALLVLIVTATALAQVRVTPEKSKGGTKWGEPWEGVPEPFRNLGVPDWKPPTDLKQWQATGRGEVRKVLRECLGEMPARPDPKKVKVLSREEFDAYTLEKFEFFNGVDMTVPGILAIPKNRKGPVPVIIGMHGHSGSKSEYIPNPANERSLGWMLVKAGYAVAAIDGYFNGERVGHGPRGKKERLFGDSCG